MEHTAGSHFSCDKLIRFHHCDPAGIVFYPQYFVLFNELVEDWFNQGLGVDFARYHVETGLGVPMGKVDCRFIAPSKVGDTLRLLLTVKRLGGASLTLHVRGESAGQTRVEATLTVVQASLTTRRSVPFNHDMRQRLARYVEASSPQ